MAFDECFSDGELAFIGRNNALTLIPLANSLTGERMDLSGVTKIDVCVGAAEASSSTSPNIISWEERSVAGVDTWVIDIQPGLVDNLLPGKAKLRVTVFDGATPEGLVVVHDLVLDVIAPC